MRFSAFLLVLAFTLAACCHGFANADDAARKSGVAASNRVVDRSAPALRKLEGAAAIDAADEERGVSGFSKLKTLMDNMPYLNRLKGWVGKNPNINAVKAAAEKSPEVKNLKAAVGNTPIKLTEKDAAKVVKEIKKRHPAVGVALSVLKMLAVVGIISFSVGFGVYMHENYP
ncbi:Avirulence (Avh) protein [Phytophthora cinnamomi]|uniref:Avirulence (Avh) protein n=1 Tax=Phytophthora cinnamomi TaxID=4785 RepID=UPI002A2CF9E3|nr:Avirulence (Avh) protein [Phytophthora cinnamomi]KAJ8548810.1 hypothetical protein ON010_g10862 [Phytophthora cinnamomi]